MRRASPIPETAALPAALGIAVLLLAGCQGTADEPVEHGTATAEEQPPLDEPADEPGTLDPEGESAEAGADDPQSLTEQNEDEPDPEQSVEHETGQPRDTGAPEDQDQAEGEEAAEEPEADNDVLDVTEFSAEPQRSRGFPDLLTEVPEDSELLLGEVRAGVHEGYHRIVFDHVGEGAPGWSAEYVDEAVEPGSGFPMELEAEAILYVGVVGLVPGNAGQEQGQLELREWNDPQNTMFTDVATTFVHHGSANYYIGLDAEREFRVSVWEHPNGPRLIIDVLV
ncbi:AMIN-like domain-containing (lipo)protein [Nesterenkonia alkaliphila]|uniref:AMIN-like domain-containing protein n=1 Tax=Nesterenkonia alkaliphila TaxID=1463631 RepID=A0A7K1UKB8_9MICC|nr:hypothetical protein [Nesterenkonia alkaliphila]MVT26920.1 hypothetical protein [Nesterenkonia alkaliphila]GFZ90702.1 hypothetical protein GCM10011359_20080 [Nesterenkonia alkaliphila]